MRARLLDLFAGAGGCAVGYHRAGFDVTGVDIEDHPDYPYELIVADAMTVLQDAEFLARFDVIHASPPCPRYSVATHASGNADDHPDFVPDVLRLLTAHGGTWIVENVEGAPLPNGVMFCGAAMGLRWIRRHRLFESSAPIMSPGCACDARRVASIYGARGQDPRVPPTSFRRGRPVYKGLTTSQAAGLLGVGWMTRRSDISDAIPPAYTEYIGAQLLDHLARAAA